MIRAVVGIIKKEDKILIAERPLGKPYSGYWEFPGGKIEGNESAKEALMRELHEELGITVLSARALFQHTHAYPDKTVVLELWMVETFEGEPQGKENQTLRWTTLDEMAGLRVLEGNLAIMKNLEVALAQPSSRGQAAG